MNMNEFEVKDLLQQADILFSQQRYEAALPYLDKVLSLDRMNKEAYILKGISLANLDNIDAAVIEFSNALKVDKKDSEAYFHLGNMAFMQGNKGKGIENYNKAIAYGYSDPQIYFNLGLMYEEENEYELALRNYSKVVLKDPLRVDARVRKSRIYIQSEKYPEALETLDELILADPDLYDGYNLKAHVLSEMGRYEEAVKVLDEASALFPKDAAFVIDKIGIFINQGKNKQAMELIKKLESEFEMELTEKRQVCLEKARIFSSEEDMTQVIKLLSAAKRYSKEIDENDIDEEVTFLLIGCYIEEKNFDKAIEFSGQLMKCDTLAYKIPSYYTLPYAYAQKGEEEKAKGLYKESISYLRKITLDNPGLLDAYVFRALCLKEIGKYDKALELSDYLLTVNENSKEFHNLKATVLQAMGKEEEASEERSVAEKLV